MKNQNESKFIATKFREHFKRSRNIKGWFSFEAAMMITLIHQYQSENDIAGDIFEIGVHHGRSSVFFAALLNESERLGVCDIFESQKFNVSSSGNGDQNTFVKNISQILPDSRFEIFKKYSTELSVEEIGTNYRIFHIDGGHNSDEALSDLRLAISCIIPGGVIIVDDPFRTAWPGVTEAIVKFLKDNTKYTSFVVGFNKLCICHVNFGLDYQKIFDSKKLREIFNIGYPYSYKSLPFCDNPLRIFYTLSNIDPNSLKSKAVNYVKSRL